VDEGLSIRPDNESRIFYANDTAHSRTEYAVLYLHGFSASWYEGYPAHVNFARYFGYNLYIPRLASHGEETEDALIDMTPDRLWESAKEALLATRVLGKKVIIMGTSTGGTLALKLAAEFPEYVEALILYSPNIRINNSAAFILSKPWGLQIGRKSNGGKYRITNTDSTSTDCKYWYCKYRMEGVVYLQQLVELTMKKETFRNVTAPVFLGYYYKDKANQDPTVRVDAMLTMFEQLGTPPENKREIAFPEAGAHVIACELTSGCYEEVTAETIRFAEEVLGLKPLK
jgi:esterase/lipase